MIIHIMPRLYSYNNMLNSTLIKLMKTKRYYCKSWLTPWNKTRCSTATTDYPQGIKNSSLPSTHGFMYNWHTSVAAQDKWSSFYTWLYLNYEQLVHKCGLTRQVVFFPHIHMALWTAGIQVWPHKASSLSSWSWYLQLIPARHIH